ncbi:MAG: hypothetical protein HOP13_05085 [Alphaproteobacteria bacterium]|nr:hypothetical protein [Alphaproteobacteria bacterium]
MVVVPKAAAAYFAIAFAIAFVLGTLRVLFVAPRVGELGAVLIEVPIMLAVSWLVCSWVLSRIAVPASIGARLVMGAVAFTLLMAAEFALGVYGFGMTAGEIVSSFARLPGQLGLSGQVGFALMPVLRLFVR